MTGDKEGTSTLPGPTVTCVGSPLTWFTALGLLTGAPMMTLTEFLKVLLEVGHLYKLGIVMLLVLLPSCPHFFSGTLSTLPPCTPNFFDDIDYRI